MKSNLMILCVGALVVGVARGAPPPTYTLSVPGAPLICDTTNATENVWLASNRVASVSSMFGPMVAAEDSPPPISQASSPITLE